MSPIEKRGDGVAPARQIHSFRDRFEIDVVLAPGNYWMTGVAALLAGGLFGLRRRRR